MTVVDDLAGTRSRPELHRLMEALRPAVMGPRLAEAVGHPGDPCHVLDAKYEPGRRGTVLYRLGDALVRGDLVAGAVASAGGAGPFVEPGVRLSVFPHDPDLPGLTTALDADALSRMLPPSSARLRRARLLRYRPGKRATLLLQTWPPDPGCVAKVYHDGSKAAAVTAEAEALSRLRLSARMLRLARPVGSVPELAMVLQQRIPGMPLDHLLMTLRPAPDALSAVCLAGRALAELHALPPVSHRRRPIQAELDRFVLRAAAAASVVPPTGVALGSLAERLHATGPPTAPVGLVHGDCKPGQFLLTPEGKVALLDLDHCGRADPASDLGTFLASLRQLDLRRRVASHTDRSLRTGQVGTAFLTAYLDVSRDSQRCVRARWYEAVALERKALRSFARAPLSPVPLTLVEEGHRCLDRLGGAPWSAR